MSAELRDSQKAPRLEKLGLCNKDIHDLVDSVRPCQVAISESKDSPMLRWLSSFLAAQRILLNEQIQKQHDDLLFAVQDQLAQLSTVGRGASLPLQPPRTVTSNSNGMPSQNSVPVETFQGVACENSLQMVNVKPVSDVQEAAPEKMQSDARDEGLPEKGQSTKFFYDVVKEKKPGHKNAPEDAQAHAVVTESTSAKPQSAKDRMMDAFLKAKGWRGPSEDGDDDDDDVPVAESPLAKSVRKIVDSGSFDLFFGLMIIINAVMMGIQLELKGKKAKLLLDGRYRDAEDFNDHKEVFHGFELFFTVVFTFELALRLFAYRLRFFRERMNWLDIVVVATSILELSGVSNGGVNFTAARMIRVFRLVRVLRVVRIANLVRSLRILVKTISSSVGALGWSMVLLAVIEVIAALFMTQLLNDFIIDESKDPTVRRFIFRYYGDTSRALLTMFEITLGGWSKVGRPIIEEVHPAFCLFFIFYVAGVSFAVMKVITAVFLRETLQVAQNDDEMQIAEKMRQKNRYVSKIRELFKAADQSGDGTVTWEEFSVILADPKIKTWLAVLELEVHEVSGLFHLLDNGDGSISFDEFMSGLIRLKGAAKSVDVVTLLYENQKILKTIKDLEREVHNVLLPSSTK